MTMTTRTLREAQPGRGPDSAGASASASAPGKQTLTETLGAGESLPAVQRSQFERSLGRDLSGVRVHTGDAAGDEADRVNARAYATGQNIVFARGAYNPFDRRSVHLLAHEVAHTAQQQGAAPSGEPATTTPGDSAERNADTAAAAMLAGEPAAVSAQPMSIARKTRDESIEEAPSPEPGGDAGGGGAAGGGAAGGGAAGDAKAGKDEPIDLSAERIGADPDEGEDVGPDVPVRNPEAGKQDIAAAGQQLPPQGGAEEAAGGNALAANAGGAGGGGAAEAGAGGGGGGGEVSGDLNAAVTSAQSDAREATAQAESESAAYKAETTEQRDRFEAEQHATMLEQIKAMSSIEKRQTLQEMGYDPKKVKKLKDAELDGLIQGKMEAEQRKTKILGMTPEELAALSPGQKLQYLVDLGIDRGDLDKAGQGKATQLFDDIMKVAHVPGQHKVKIKIKGGLLGKSWVVTVKCDADGNTDVQAQKEGGFLSKLWGWVKAALPIILTVLAPLTAGVSLIVLGVYQAAMAIKSGDWLGAVLGAVTAIGGVSTFLSVAKGASAAAATFSKISDVAKKVQKVAEAAQAAMTAAKAKNAGSLLAALSQGAAAFAAFSGKAASKFAETMDRWSKRLDKWAKIVSGGQRVVQGIQKGDPIGALGGALDTAVAALDKSSDKKPGDATAGAKTGTVKALERASKITGLVGAGKRALQSNPPNYAAVAEAALGIAGQLKEDRRIDDASRIIARADALKQAWDKRASDPGALAAAALGLAEAIQLAKYDVDHDAPKDANGKPKPEEDRAAITKRYERAGNIVRSASGVLKAATAKPRPNYVAALDAATQLVAELTESKQIDAAAMVTSKLDAWTQAVNSKDDKAIFQAGIALGQAIDGLRTVIAQEHASAKQAAQAAGQTLPDDDATLPPGPSDAAQAPGDTAPGATTPTDAAGGAAGPTRAPEPKTGERDAAPTTGPDAAPQPAGQGTEPAAGQCPTCGGATKDGSCEDCGTKTGAGAAAAPTAPACYPTNRPAGPYHEAIQAQYIATVDPTGVREYAIPASSAAGNIGYADIASLGTGAIYEIKPYIPSEIAAGATQVAGYVAAANVSCGTPPAWHPGFAYPDSVIPLGADQEIVAKQYNNPGLILYYTRKKQRQPQPKPVPVPVPVPIPAPVPEDERKPQPVPVPAPHPEPTPVPGPMPVPVPVTRSRPTYQQVFEVVVALGLSISLVVVILAALLDPEPATKLALAGLSVAMIAIVLDKFGLSKPDPKTPQA
jgi:Domain of unknown function (DUF4157)